MPDQIIDAVMARGLHADACRARPLVGWFVLQDLPDYPGKLAARLVADGPTPYGHRHGNRVWWTARGRARLAV